MYGAVILVFVIYRIYIAYAVIWAVVLVFVMSDIYIAYAVIRVIRVIHFIRSSPSSLSTCANVGPDLAYMLVYILRLCPELGPDLSGPDLVVVGLKLGLDLDRVIALVARLLSILIHPCKSSMQFGSNKYTGRRAR